MSKDFRLSGLNALLAIMIAFAGIVGTASMTSAQNDGPVGDITGNVRDAETDVPLPGALVCLDGIDDSCVEANEYATWIIEDVPYDTYIVTANLDGYESGELEVIVDGSNPVGVANFKLSQSPVYYGDIIFTVKDAESGEWLESAEVCINDGATCAYANELGNGIIEDVPYDTYTVTANFDGYELASQQVTIEAGNTLGQAHFQLTKTPAADPILVFVNVVAGDSGLTELPEDTDIQVLDGDGEWVAGASVGAAELPLEGYSYELPDANATYTVGLIGADAESQIVTVTDGVVTPETVTLILAGSTEPPVEEAGTVAISVFLCAGQDELLWNEEPGPDCGYDAGNFIFYPVDGDEGDFEDIFVDGQGSIDLPAGDYEVFQEFFPDTSTIISVTAGETTELTVLNPGTSEPETYPVMFTATTPDEGSAEGALVYVASDDGVQTFFQVAPEPNGTLNADNSFSMQLPAGDYLVTIDAIDQGYNVATVPFTVPGTGDVVTIALETAPVLPDEGYVHIHHYTCEGLAEVIFDGTLDQVHEGCTPTPATLTFYLYGDGTDDHWQVTTDESGVTGIELLVGEYEVVHEATQAKADVTVLAGAVTELVVLSPEQAETPDEGDTGEEGKTPEEKDKGKKKSAVSELPKTGSGQQTSTTHMAAMLVAAAAVSAAAGGVALRQKRS